MDGFRLSAGSNMGFPEQDAARSLFVDARNKADEMTRWMGIVLGLTCWDAVVPWLRCITGSSL